MPNELINRFKYLFEYDNGKLIRRVPRGNSKKGDHCGHVEKKGYRSTEVDGKAYKNHRIIFSMIYDFIVRAGSSMNRAFVIFIFRLKTLIT